MTNTLRSFADGDTLRVDDAFVTVEIDGVTFRFHANEVEFLRHYNEVPFNIHADDSEFALSFRDELMSHCTFTVLAGGVQGVEVSRDGDSEMIVELRRGKAEQARRLQEFLRVSTRAGALEL
jgi:hypothetical protein